jgi:hypothetical protein
MRGFVFLEGMCMKILLLAIIFSFGIGLWFGINVGKGNALYENPLNDPDVLSEVHESADDAGLLDQGEAFLNNKKDMIKGKVKDMVDDL